MKKFKENEERKRFIATLKEYITKKAKIKIPICKGDGLGIQKEMKY